HLVGDVVHLAAEGIERRDRAAPVGGQEEEAVVEARAARRGLLLAILVGGHTVRVAALARIHTQSSLPSRGRWRKTSPRTATILSRMAAPPATVARISSPKRPGSMAPSGAPSMSIARARPHSKSMSCSHASPVLPAAISASLTP